MRRKMIGLCEAYKKYGFEGVKRPRYVPDGFCEWCGGELPKRRTSCCCEECTRSFNLETNPAWGSAAGGGYRNHIMRRDNYTCQRCGEFHALINENGIPLPTSDGELDVHHKIQVSDGGSDAPDNLITLCRKCHREIHSIKNLRFSGGETVMKKILDACCGGKAFWFDKDNPDVEFCDIRELPKTEYYPGKYIEINPDTVCNFTDLSFDDNSFYLVVFDPPHLQWAGEKSIMALKYGKLTGDWKAMLSAGFDECMRVLKPNGVLVFKWSEVQFPLSEILPLFSQTPLFGNRCRKRGNKTHWLCFMKD